MSVLDDPDALARLDPSGMLASVHGLPEQCAEAWSASAGLRLTGDYAAVDKIVILGMGGSAIAGDLFRVLLARESRVPVFNVRQYDLPPYVDERTLVVASSYSGMTEETLSAFNQALATPARKLVITGGGKLLATARANGVPVFHFEFKGEPRAAIGWSLMPLLRAAESIGLMQGVGIDVAEAVAAMRTLRAEINVDAAESKNPAKSLARRLDGRLPVIYGAGPLYEVAHRWKSQLNESSKVWAFHEELPEIHHNAIIGYALPEKIARDTLVVLLRSEDLVHPRVLLRYEFTRDLLARSGVESDTVAAAPGSALAQVLSLTLFGDFVSGYLALLNGVDPTPTAVIDELKAWLAGRP